jgi:hypothetical protein
MMTHLWPAHIARDAALLAAAFLLVLWMLVRQMGK